MGVMLIWGTSDLAGTTDEAWSGSSFMFASSISQVAVSSASQAELEELTPESIRSSKSTSEVASTTSQVLSTSAFNISSSISQTPIPSSTFTAELKELFPDTDKHSKVALISIIMSAVLCLLAATSLVVFWFHKRKLAKEGLIVRSSFLDLRSEMDVPPSYLPSKHRAV